MGPITLLTVVSPSDQPRRGGMVRSLLPAREYARLRRDAGPPSQGAVEALSRRELGRQGHRPEIPDIILGPAHQDTRREWTIVDR